MRWMWQALTAQSVSLVFAQRIGCNVLVLLRIRRAVAKALVFAMLIAIVSPVSVWAQSDDDIAALKQRGFELYQAGKYDEALPVANQYAGVIEGRYGTAHPEYAIALYYIAEVLRASNRLTDAEPLYRQALAIGEKALGADDPKLADVLGRLGEVYFSQGRYAEADLHTKRQLYILENKLGFDRPRLASSLGWLGHIYRVQARFLEAEPLMRRALAIDEVTFGKDHPEVATALSK